MSSLALAGRTAVVTGAAQGVGFAVATAFREQGARIVLADIDGEAVEKAVAALGGGPDVTGRACDVRCRSDLEALLDLAESGDGPAHVLVNNAGITRDATMRTMTEDDFDAVLAVNLKGVWIGTLAAGARMRAAGRGSIINMSSLSGKVGMAGQTNCSAAKAGVIGLTKAAAKELAHLGVRVNAIAPGLIRTPMTEAMPAKAWEKKMSEIPMGRAGEPAEVASAALLLASDWSSYMTGTVLEVTGGRFM